MWGEGIIFVDAIAAGRFDMFFYGTLVFLGFYLVCEEFVDCWRGFGK